MWIDLGRLAWPALGRTHTCHASCPCAHMEEVLVMVSPVPSLMCYMEFFLFIIWNLYLNITKNAIKFYRRILFNQICTEFHVSKSETKLIDQLHYIATLKAWLRNSAQQSIWVFS